MRKTNYVNISVKYDTKQILKELLDELDKNYLSGATYDDLVKVLVTKHKKIKLTSQELKYLVAELRGVRWD